MATTFVEYSGDGQASKQFTFPSYQESDVKVRVDGVLKTTSTHYNITNYTTTGGGFVVFTSGNIPSSGIIRIYRDTNVDTAKATFTAGSSVKAADLNNNHTQLLYRSQEEQIPNLIHSYDIDAAAIETSNIKDANVTTAKIADNAVTTGKVVDSAITNSKIATNAITGQKIGSGAVTTDKIGADAVTGAKIADDQINSEHYVDGSIDTAHIADAQITTAKIAADAIDGTKIADNSINSEHYVDGSIDTAHLDTNVVTSPKLADNAVTSSKIADGNVLTAKIPDNAITTAKIADSNVTTAKIAADAVDNTKIADNSINSEHYVDGSIDTIHLAANCVTSAKIADSAVNTSDINNSAVTTDKIADANITAAKIASNAVTTDKIADGELTTLAGMQSGTASVLADSTALTASTAELNQLDGITLETSITTNSDTRIPTSKAVNDLVLSVTNALGGFVAIANETSFPTTNPDPSNNAGTVVSISQLANGLAVNGSGVATIANGAGTGNTVTITGFPSSLVSQTLPANSGLQVQTTSTLHTYTFHKQLASAADIQAISATVNSFSARYRVSASAPTSSLDGGDLWYDTTNSKLMVYSSVNSAWEESSAIGNFFICTVSSSLNTGGGSATPNGTAYRFAISNAPTTAAALIVSVDGVVQKPNSGSSQPSEGFVLVGNDIIFGAAPANGASLFVTAIGSTVGIGTPSNNTVTSAILQNGSVTTAKIVDANVTTAKITDNAVQTAKIADDAVTGAKIASTTITNDNIALGTILTGRLADNAITTAKIADDQITLAKMVNNSVGTAKIVDNAVTAAKLADTSVTAGSYGSSSAIPVITVDAQGRLTAASTVATTSDLVGDTSPQLGGDLDTNSHEILLDDNHAVKFGASNDLLVYHNSQNWIASGVDGTTLHIDHDITQIRNHGGTKVMAKFFEDGACELYHANSKKLQTTANGIELTGSHSIFLGGKIDMPDSSSTSTGRILLGTGDDLQIYHDGSNSYLDNSSGALHIRGGGDIIYLKPNNSETALVAKPDGEVELLYNGSQKFETTNTGVSISGGVTATATSVFSGTVNCQADDDTRLRLNVPSNNSDDWNYISYYGRDGNRDGFIGSWSDGTMTVYSDASGGHFIKFHSGSIEFNNHLLPDANSSKDLGSSGSRWRNIYTNDLNLSNEGSSNDVDGSWGDWTIQEGESDLFLKNNRSGKKYKFNLTEVS